MSYLPCEELQTNSDIDISGVVIWLHGLGSDGNDFVPVVRELNLPASLNVKFIFPHAPSMAITVNGGYVMPAWYDIFELTLDRKIDERQLRISSARIQALIDREIAFGVPSDKIILAGFSQGGAVVYEAALTYEKPLAGLLTLSTYFATSDTIQEDTANKKIPILIQHGTQDAVVSEVLGQRAYRQLKDRGYTVDYESYPMDHTLCAEQVEHISNWLQSRLKPASRWTR